MRVKEHGFHGSQWITRNIKIDTEPIFFGRTSYVIARRIDGVFPPSRRSNPVFLLHRFPFPLLDSSLRSMGWVIAALPSVARNDTSDVMASLSSRLPSRRPPRPVGRGQARKAGEAGRGVDASGSLSKPTKQSGFLTAPIPLPPSRFIPAISELGDCPAPAPTLQEVHLPGRSLPSRSGGPGLRSLSPKYPRAGIRAHCGQLRAAFYHDRDGNTILLG
jgi:hypothetical protein